jgi:DNA topoisomerase I
MKPALKAQEHILIDPGYRQAYQAADAPQIVSPAVSRLANIQPGQRIKPRRVRVQHKAPPTGIGETSLLALLRKHTIGRPATYAGIVDSLLAREYARRDPAGLLIPTARGRSVCNFLTRSYPRIFDVGFSALMEQSLDAIATGQANYKDVIKTLWQELNTKTP